MTLPKTVTNFLNNNARLEGVSNLKPQDDLFKKGALDSFALVEFLSLLEQECGISVPDQDVLPANFQSINAVERYVESRQK